ncbi:hypothetical protein E2562_007283 [Oryza meyeriana var. granulata]|uniref:DUF834 domain-containing protein n=1 Tax=Oryza meyeriana var. granulata TaxID=110450 RepID=A0A6G1CEI9_9ORYZ|nr:hypothetical protein E2562_007283 [Oryza meyeriana var. granulata]
MRTAVAKAEDRSTEVDVGMTNIVVSLTSWSHRHLHRSAWRSKRRLKLPHQPKAVEDGGGNVEVEAMVALEEVEVVAANQPRSGHGWSTAFGVARCGTLIHRSGGPAVGDIECRCKLK